ncbi:hypothetical protein A1O7_05901 [Cladophialophora yegresii CBS 114405]|uniref:Heterokaryon incompatibility domain-containing protein n=1 Tax=Cladophialophora yegresii CBS 114405 TaxID=1182544 RepID=W9W1U2_9EURO|nr:uncharacterized protein A1O7_05901 [Cladophialophora yegresii CBS 114405]EXJ58476.1 hypothetical protein A1O7_05901 [Cladophialophora yegresii CBS 114405]
MSTVTVPDLSLVIRAEASAPLALKYQYTPLPIKGWTRIIRLHPGSANDRLSCSLEARKIHDAAAPSSFEALSYVWGVGDVDAVEMDCDGRVMRIGENLACALKHIRQRNEIRYLWADAVCIDQENIEERSSQVQQMSEIYSSADRVTIWIGPDLRDEAKECFTLIRDTTTILADLIAEYGGVSLFPTITPESGRICSDTQQWEMVQRLMDTEWFSRVWVLQEIGLARSGVVLYGNSSLNWAYLVELMLIVASRPDVSSHVGNIKSGMIWDFYEDLWRSYGNPSSWRNELPMTRSLNDNQGQASFINILNDSRGYKATDQRDRVYAFLGHPSAGCEPLAQTRLLVPDYSLSVDQVYLDIARRILDTDSNPWTVLTCVDHTQGSPSLSGRRPSWVPRWDEGWRVYWLGYTDMWYRAGGTNSNAFRSEVSPAGSSLILYGIIVDSISWTSRPFDSDELRLEPQKAKAPLQQLWWELQKHDDNNTIYGSSTQDQEYAFSLTLAAGRGADEGPSEDDPDHHRAVYQAYKMLLGGTDTDQRPASKEDIRDNNVQRKEDEQNSIKLEALTYGGSNQRRALHNRRLFRTSRGYYGVGHRAVEAGDMCYVFRGANVPLVVRKVMADSNAGETTAAASDHYVLIGEAYIQGIMRGELFLDAEAAEALEEAVVLV